MLSKFLLPAFACGAVSCASLSAGPAHHYLTDTPRSVRSTRADSIKVHIEERLSYQMNATLVMGRRDGMEQAACGHVERAGPSELWVDSLLEAWVVSKSATNVVFSCPSGSVPIHWHVLFEWQGWDQCGPSPIDMSKVWAKYPGEGLVCGFGVDSMVFWRARP